MNPEEFSNLIRKKGAELKAYTESVFPSKAGNTSLRFVNGNFRAQGFQGASFKRWKPNKRKGTVLVKSGKLRAANYFTSQSGQATIKNQMPYAGVHNNGFKGTVNVKAHKRNQYGQTKVGTGKFTKTGKERQKTMTMKTGEGKVKAHTRQVNIPQRQFMPTNQSPSPILDNAIKREVMRDINKIMQ